MTRGRLAVAAGVAVVLAAWAVVSVVVLPARARRQALQRLLLGPGEIPDSLVVERDGERLEIRRRPSGSWSLKSGSRELSADDRAVTQLLRALQGRSVTSVVGPVEQLKLSDHGLDPPRVRLAWTRPEGRAWTLDLGVPGMAGQVHARAGDEVVLVPAEILAAADRGLDHFRVKRVLEADEDAVTALEITRRRDQVPAGASERLALVRTLLPGTAEDDDAHEWTLAEPLGVPANTVRLASLLSRLASLEAKGFGAEAPDAESLHATGLAAPAAVLRLTLGEAGTRVLALGDPSPEGNAWARVDDGPIVEIRSDVARDALLPDDFWRDTRVVKVPEWRLARLRVRTAGFDVELEREPGAPWQLARPRREPADPQAAGRLIDALSDLSCGRFEDELARDAARLDARWNFGGPGSVAIEALALLPDGTPRRSSVELAPFVRERQVYFASRAVDEMGRVEACVTTERLMDDVLEEARALAAPPGAAPPRP